MNQYLLENKRFYPTLRTVLIVEKFLSDNHSELFSKAGIIRGLNGKINNKSLTTILDYLESSNKIMQGDKGIQWIFSNSKKSKKLMKEALVF
ncbi:MAG: hypothetical protein KJ583_06820 [Nanoarchaeota archaeon]|nr:hypothetical protein [Nanoarchaeota archaeon]MBU1270074.1 hypothetical protein [Nanoarchaeota archaeon]MBU1604997.1 hypothetical protein [Nanoarchaeota archaeon]MBU2443410.1 hypothetical protein [Nanoarchaeota archaeon]